MTNTTGVLRSAMALALALFLFSCASTRQQDGFSYRPAEAGPDMGSDEPLHVEVSQPAPSPMAMQTNVQPSAAMAVVHSGDEQAPVPANLTVIGEMAETGVQQMEKKGGDLKTAMRTMAADYADKHDLRLSGRQLRKLDRLAVKMEKKFAKKQGPDVSWGPSNNLEWAILGAAAVGLFVGIFGIGFGWFIFLVAALAYLYFKLLHNN